MFTNEELRPNEHINDLKKVYNRQFALSSQGQLDGIHIVQ